MVFALARPAARRDPAANRDGHVRRCRGATDDIPPCRPADASLRCPAGRRHGAGAAGGRGTGRRLRRPDRHRHDRHRRPGQQRYRRDRDDQRRHPRLPCHRQAGAPDRVPGRPAPRKLAPALSATGLRRVLRADLAARGGVGGLPGSCRWRLRHGGDGYGPFRPRCPLGRGRRKARRFRMACPAPDRRGRQGPDPRLLRAGRRLQLFQRLLGWRTRGADGGDALSRRFRRRDRRGARNAVSGPEHAVSRLAGARQYRCGRPGDPDLGQAAFAAQGGGRRLRRAGRGDGRADRAAGAVQL